MRCDLPTRYGAREQKVQTAAMFRLAYLSIIGVMVSVPIHLMTNLQQTSWVIYGLMAATVVFLTAGMMRRP